MSADETVTDASEVARPWPECPWCEEDELACISGDAAHRHTRKCLLYCYRCGRQVASVEQLDAYALRYHHSRLSELEGKLSKRAENERLEADRRGRGNGGLHDTHVGGMYVGRAQAFREAADLLKREREKA